MPWRRCPRELNSSRSLVLPSGAADMWVGRAHVTPLKVLLFGRLRSFVVGVFPLVYRKENRGVFTLSPKNEWVENRAHYMIDGGAAASTANPRIFRFSTTEQHL